MECSPISRKSITGWLGNWVLAGCLLVVLSGAAIGDDSRQAGRLAVLVTGGTDEAVALQALLEAEAQQVWSGEIIERKQLDLVLGEQRFATAFDTAARLKLGRLLNADYLLIVRFQQDQVLCLVNRFPQATVVAEFQVARVSPDAVAKRIAVQAFREIRIQTRRSDRQAFHVSLGSFLCDDPFDRFTKFSDKLHQNLRKRISKQPRIVAAERFYPSQLLREFQLGRNGLAKAVAENLSAPPSDVLIVGQIRPSKVQPLDDKAVELSFTIQLTSPTGLFASRNVQFKTDGPNIAQASERIESALKQLLDSPEVARPATNRRPNDSEFQTLKQQALRLMPYPPKLDGNFHSNGSYRGSSQVGGKPYQLNRALRAVENAMLFRGDDTQLLVCAGVLMQGLASYVRGSENRNFGSLPPSPRVRALLTTGFDYLENALLLESNENTRGVCYEVTTWRDRPLLPDRARAMSARIVREGTAAGWFPHQVKWAWIWQARLAPHVGDKIQLVRQATDANVEPDTLFNLLETIDRTIANNPKDLSATARANDLADDMIARESAFHRSIGHYLRSRVRFHASSPSSEWLPHLRRSIELIPACFDENGAEFTRCSLSYRVYDMITSLVTDQPSGERSSDTLNLFELYATKQTEIANYRSSSLPQCMSLLLPSMYDTQRYHDALQLLTPLVENYDGGGSADFERMRLVRWLDRLQQAIAPEPRLTKDELQRIEMPEIDRPTRIKKLLFADDRLWVTRNDYWLQDQIGELFELPINATAATRAAVFDGVVTDIAVASNQLAVATIDNGLYLLDFESEKTQRLHPGNSPLPSPKVRTVAAAGSRFYVGLPGQGAYHFYELAADAKTLRDLDLKRSYHSYYSTKFCQSDKQLVMQRWDERTLDDECQTYRMIRKPLKNAVHATTVHDKDKNVLFEHTGVDLNYVYDFTLWRGQFIFATGNGLYVASPGSAHLRCVMNDLDTEFFSLLGVGDSLFVGTNDGLYRVRHQQLQSLPRGDRADATIPRHRDTRAPQDSRYAPRPQAPTHSANMDRIPDSRG